MKIYLALLFSLIGFGFLNAQTTKVAILDFENTSGKTEYDALGKAISSMLITDLANNIHPKKVEFFERSQLNKLLDEQKLQKSKNFDAKTAVDFGKLSGVNYVFVGSVFVLDGTCNFSSKMVDVQTSKILLAKDVSGKIESWLQLKSQLAEAIANQLNNPITLDPPYKDQSASLATITQYGKVLTTMDEGDADKAEQLRGVFQETTPDFKYFDDIKGDIEKLKQRVAELENVTEVLTDNFDLGDKAEMKKDFKSAIKYFEKFINNPGNQGFVENKKLYAYSKLARCQFLIGDYTNALNNSQKAQLIYKFFPEANETELMSLNKLEKHSDAENKFNFILDSLTFTNELNFRRQIRNNQLVWESINGLYFGLLSEESSDEWIYLGIRNNGYGTSPENEVKIKKLLSENSLKLIESKNKLSQYHKLEDKLLSYNDSLIFSSDQILNFYKLSYKHADELDTAKDYESLKKHLEKEIRRMESFGVPCKQGCSDPNMKIPLSYGSDQSGILSSLGLSNSTKEFDDNFHLIYGQFIYRYLILLLKENQIKDAALFYKKISTKYVKDRDSYFYGYYWDVILGFRNASDYFNPKLSSSEFEIKLIKRIESKLKELAIPCINFENIIKVKNEKSIINKDAEILEEDPKIKSELKWSKNASLVQDGKGNKFQLATEENISRFKQDSVPAYCYYDFDESNAERYGKLYNYWAFKLLVTNPPEGWRIIHQKDFSDILNLGVLLDKSNQGKNPYQQRLLDVDDLLSIIRFKDDELPFDKSGFILVPGFFCCIDSQAWFWTDEIGKDCKYQKVVKIFDDGQVQFSDYLAKEGFFSIRMIKSK